MKTNIKATNLGLSPAIRAYLEEKVGTLERILPVGDDSVLIDAEVGKDTNHHLHGDIFRAEVNVRFSGRVLRAEAFNEDLYAAIDEVRDDITRQINSNIEKKHTLLRRGGRLLKGMLRGINPLRFRRNKKIK